MEKLFGIDETEAAARRGVFRSGSERVYRYIEEASFTDAMRTQIITSALRKLVDPSGPTRSPQILAFAESWFRGDAIVHALYAEMEAKPESHSDLREFFRLWEDEFKRQRLIVMNQRFDQHLRDLAWASLIQEVGRQEGFSGVDGEQLEEEYKKDFETRLESFRNDQKEIGLGVDQRSQDARFRLRYTEYLKWAQLRLFPWETTRGVVAVELEKMRKAQVTEDMRRSYVNAIVTGQIRKTGGLSASWHQVKTQYQRSQAELEGLMKGSRQELQKALWNDPVLTTLLEVPTADLTRLHVRKAPPDRLTGEAKATRLKEIEDSLQRIQSEAFETEVLTDLQSALQTAQMRDKDHLKAAFEKSRSRYESNRRDVSLYNTTRLYDLAIVIKDSGLEGDSRVLNASRTLLREASAHLVSSTGASAGLETSVLARRQPEDVANSILLPWTVAAIRRVKGIASDGDSKDVAVSEAAIGALRELGNNENLQIKLLMFTRWQIAELLGRLDLEREVQIANTILRDHTETLKGIRRLKVGTSWKALESQYGIRTNVFQGMPLVLTKDPSTLRRDENITGGVEIGEYMRLVGSVAERVDPDTLEKLERRVLTQFDPVARDGVIIYEMNNLKAPRVASLYDSQLALQDVLDGQVRRESTSKLKRRWLERDYVVSLIGLQGPLDRADAISRINANRLSRSHEFMLEVGDFTPTKP
jgi:hypothetical protein